MHIPARFETIIHTFWHLYYQQEKHVQEGYMNGFRLETFINEM